MLKKGMKMKCLSNNTINKKRRASIWTTVLLSASISWQPHTGLPVSLDGTTGTALYESAQYPFAHTDFAAGYVRLAGGFSVPSGAEAFMSVHPPVSGIIDLNNTGMVTLGDDLNLASNVKLTSGGRINGMGYSIFLNHHLSLQGQILEVISNTVIDGRGNTLFLSGTQGEGILFINGAPGTRVTLKNMRIRGNKTYGFGFPSIVFGGAPNQCLVLQNVIFHLGDNFLFTGGKLEIRGETKITGLHTFDFRASEDILIKDDATLCIDTGTRFNYRPTDLDKNHLILNTRDSRLHLMGATLFAPKNTGLHLSRGQLLVDHKSVLKSNGAVEGDQAFEFGDGSMAGELTVNIAPGASLEIEDGFLKYQNQE